MKSITETENASKKQSINKLKNMQNEKQNKQATKNN